MQYSLPDDYDIIQRYSRQYKQYGYSPKALGWDKGKQEVRFDVLTSQYDFAGKSILDVGCGFGDLNTTLAAKYGTNYTYHGVELVAEIIEEGRNRFPAPHITFSVASYRQNDTAIQVLLRGRCQLKNVLSSPMA